MTAWIWPESHQKGPHALPGLGVPACQPGMVVIPFTENSPVPAPHWAMWCHVLCWPRFGPCIDLQDNCCLLLGRKWSWSSGRLNNIPKLSNSNIQWSHHPTRGCLTPELPLGPNAASVDDNQFPIFVFLIVSHFFFPLITATWAISVISLGWHLHGWKKLVSFLALFQSPPNRFKADTDRCVFSLLQPH